MTALTTRQRTELQAELVPEHGVPVRFLIDGCAIDIMTGVACKKGSNVIYHPVYWGFTRATSRKVASWLGARAVFGQPTVDEAVDGVILKNGEWIPEGRSMLGRGYKRGERVAVYIKRKED